MPFYEIAKRGAEEMKHETHCPTCGHIVTSIFDHVDIDCNADMTIEEINKLVDEDE